MAKKRKIPPQLLRGSKTRKHLAREYEMSDSTFYRRLRLPPAPLIVATKKYVKRKKNKEERLTFLSNLPIFVIALKNSVPSYLQSKPRAGSAGHSTCGVFRFLLILHTILFTYNRYTSIITWRSARTGNWRGYVCRRIFWGLRKEGLIMEYTNEILGKLSERGAAGELCTILYK